MQIFSDRTTNGAVTPSWQSIDRQLRRVEHEVASHPGRGLLVAAMLGLLLGIWLKRK
jgi:hypothetical protein